MTHCSIHSASSVFFPPDTALAEIVNSAAPPAPPESAPPHAASTSPVPASAASAVARLVSLSISHLLAETMQESYPRKAHS